MDLVLTNREQQLVAYIKEEIMGEVREWIERIVLQHTDPINEELTPEPEYVPNTVDSIKEFQDDWLREREEKERYIASLLNED